LPLRAGLKIKTSIHCAAVHIAMEIDILRCDIRWQGRGVFLQEVLNDPIPVDVAGLQG
jgi:hypothetical protein